MMKNPVVALVRLRIGRRIDTAEADRRTVRHFVLYACAKNVSEDNRWMEIVGHTAWVDEKKKKEKSDGLIQFSSSEILGRQRKDRGSKVPCRGPTYYHLPESESFHFPIESFHARASLQVELGRPCPGPVLPHFFSRYRLVMCRTIPLPSGKRKETKKKKRWDLQAECITRNESPACCCTVLVSFLLSSRASCQCCAHPSGGDLPGQNCGGVLFGLQIFRPSGVFPESSSFDFFLFVPFLFSLVRSCTDVQRRFCHDLHCPWPWLFLFSLTSRKKSAVALSAPSLRFDFFGYFQLFGTHCRHDVNQPKNIKKFKKSGTNWGGQSNAWLCQQIG